MNSEYRTWLKSTKSMQLARNKMARLFAKGGVAPFRERTANDSGFYNSSKWENLWGDIFNIASDVIDEDD